MFGNEIGLTARVSNTVHEERAAGETRPPAFCVYDRQLAPGDPHRLQRPLRLHLIGRKLLASVATTQPVARRAHWRAALLLLVRRREKSASRRTGPGVRIPAVKITVGGYAPFSTFTCASLRAGPNPQVQQGNDQGRSLGDQPRFAASPRSQRAP